MALQFRPSRRSKLAPISIAVLGGKQAQRRQRRHSVRDQPRHPPLPRQWRQALSYMGWSDPLGAVRETLDYYSTVERVMGGPQATQDFYRLFMAPGMNHCSGGDGATQIDWLAALDTWVDGHKVPDSISGYHPDADGKPAFFRTVSPFLSENEH